MNESTHAPSPTLADRERTMGDTEDRSQVPGLAPAADARLLHQLRQGDADAGYQFVREYYPGVYRYLLYLTGRPEAAEDLAQAGEPRFGAEGDSGGGRAPGSCRHGAVSKHLTSAVRCGPGCTGSRT